MNGKETILFGVPIPSDNKIFLTIVTVHILLGIVCVVSGLLAMLSKKGGRIHIVSGRTYYWGLMLIFVTVVPLSIMRWPFNNHLLILGMLSFGTAYYGRRAIRQGKSASSRLHTICMGSSYIFLLTAFYVDNGKHLPFWNQFSQLFFWLFPAVLGIPIIVYSVLRHPLNRRVQDGRSKEV